MSTSELDALLARLEELGRRADELLVGAADFPPDPVDAAILQCLGERIHDKRSLAAALAARGHSISPSSVNSRLYRLQKSTQVTCVAGQPPLWRLPRPEDAEFSAPALKPNSLNRPNPPAKSAAELNLDRVGILDHRIWRVACDEATLAGDSLSKKPLLQAVSARSGVTKTQVEQVLRGRLPSLRGPDLRKLTAERSAATADSWWRESLERKILTPAGNLRAGPAVITTGGRASTDPGTIQVLTTTGDRPVWVCALAGHVREWEGLAETAETLSSGWNLPLRPAKGLSPSLPGPLIWRLKQVETAIRLVALLVDDFTDLQPRSVRIDVPLQSRRVGDKNDPEAEVHRLVRRRGSIPAGRKYPIRGTCDLCGMPLSDPYSLQVGIGPVCRRSYSAAVLAKVAATSGSSPDFDGLLADVEAVHHLRSAWHDASTNQHPSH